MSTHTPGPGEHGYRVTPARFCAGCGKDVSEGCPCCAPTRISERHWCKTCQGEGYRQKDEADELLRQAAPDLMTALQDLLLVAEGSTATDAELYALDERYGTETSTWAETVQAVHDRAKAVLDKARVTP